MGAWIIWLSSRAQAGWPARDSMANSAAVGPITDRSLFNRSVMIPPDSNLMDAMVLEMCSSLNREGCPGSAAVDRGELCGWRVRTNPLAARRAHSRAKCPKLTEVVTAWWFCGPRLTGTA